MSKRASGQRNGKQDMDAQEQVAAGAPSDEVKATGTESTVTIDGMTFTLESLGHQGREQLQNLRVTDQEIRRLQDQLAIMQTARNTYARLLAGVVKDVESQT